MIKPFPRNLRMIKAGKQETETDRSYTIYRHGVFCLEGDWCPDLKNASSVEPVLRLLADSHTSRVPYIHRDIGTAGELRYYLEKWTQSRYVGYPILYMGFHGRDGRIILGDKRTDASKVGLDEIEQWLRGRCRRRILYFGSCEAIMASAKRLQEFLKNTRAVAILGYGKPVDWIEATVFETLLLGELQYNAITRSGLRAAQARIKKLLSGSSLYRHLGFRMVIRDS